MKPTEVEIKLALAPHAADAFATAEALAGSAAQRSEMDNIYFDTPQLLLRAHGMALRLRNDNGNWLQTLKTAGGHGTLSTRGEWETAAKIADDEVHVDFERLADSPLPALLRKHRAGQTLAPAVRTRFMRMRWICRHRGATVEVALDRGEVIALGKPPHTSEPICEVELELAEGAPDDLVDFARTLVESRAARDWHLLPAIESKAERGFRRIAGDRTPAVIKASARGFVAALDAQMPAARALREVVRHGAGVLAANAEGLRLAASPEHVHQARVAMRRMRSAIRLFDPDKSDFPIALLKRLRALAQALGDARDWDVLLEQTMPAVARSDPSAQDTQWMRHAEREQKRARRRAIRAVSSQKFTRLVLALEAWCFTPAPVSASLQASSRRLLNGVADRLFDAAAHFDRLSAKQRHRVRIYAKRLRYALDLLAVALPVKATQRYVDALAELQDVLGAMNDAEVANDRLAAATTTPAAHASFAPWFADAQQQLAGTAHAKLIALQAQPRPWNRRKPR